MTQAPYSGLAYTLLFVLLLGILRLSLNKHATEKKARVNQETFIPSLSLLVDEKPDKLTITVPRSLKTRSLLMSGIKNVHVIEPKDEVSKPIDTSVVIDAFTAKEMLADRNQHHLLTPIDTESVAYFVRSLEMRSKGFVEDGVRIGYVNDLDKQLIKSLMMAKKNNNTMTSYSLKQVTPTSTITSKSFEDNGIDVLFIYETLEGEGLTKRFDKSMKLEVRDYADTLDIHKLKVSFPFIKHRNIDFSLHFPQLKGKLDIVSGVIAFDNIIMLTYKDSTNPNVALELQKLVQYYNKPDSINVYERYFPISPISSEYVKQRTKFFLERGSLEILEQFEQNEQSKTSGLKDALVFDVNENVNGFFDSQSNLFYLYSDSIVGIPLKKDSVFSFSGQVRDDQNGVFKVIRATPKQSILERVRNLEAMETKTQRSIASKLQPGYLCYNRPDIASKAACESPYDSEGQAKKQPTYWDKPCEKHTECPFYQANKNYPNYRGGCVDGRCEMPIGVTSVSYRLYDKQTSTPLCHNCKASSPLCCEEQKDRKLYPFLKGPDYAFELDEFERPLSLVAKS